MKRAFDVLIAALSLLCLTPVILAVVVVATLDALLVSDDRGPLFYRERRVSRGREFGLIKLRTLRRGVLERAAGHARLLEADSTNLTWTGRHLLKPWYLDELPQLLNVLIGDMSLVGPRPWPPALVAAQVAEGRDYRLRVSAGLTGPAQIAKGTGETFLGLDLEYVRALEALSPWQLLRLDLRILRGTAGVLARGEGLSF